MPQFYFIGKSFDGISSLMHLTKYLSISIAIKTARTTKAIYEKLTFSENFV